MTFDPAILRELTVGLELDGYLRIIPQAHRATPLGTSHGLSRFSSADGSFTLLYAARDLATAIAERIVRDRYQGKRRRTITLEEIGHFAIAAVSTRAPLRLIDLRTSGVGRLGVPTDAVRARSQQAGRRFSQQLYDTTNFDGIVYMSRLTNAECVAVYDRAVGARLDPACAVHSLNSLAGLIPALASLSVELQD